MILGKRGCLLLALQGENPHENPHWIQKLLLNFENRDEPFQEVEKAEALASVSKG